MQVIFTYRDTVTKDHSVCELRLITFLKSLSKRLSKRAYKEEKDIVGNKGRRKRRAREERSVREKGGEEGER